MDGSGSRFEGLPVEVSSEDEEYDPNLPALESVSESESSDEDEDGDFGSGVEEITNEEVSGLAFEFH